MSEKRNGYVYLRDNKWFHLENVYKLGISFSLINRADTYNTGEVRRGHFPLVIDLGTCSSSRLRIIENLLAHNFRLLHRDLGGGKEFYDRSILDQILPTLSRLHISFTILREEDIQSRVQYENRSHFKKLVQRMFDRWSHQYQHSVKPYDFQKDVLQHMPLFFQNHDKLKLVWPCGLGKALFGLFVVKKMRFKTILIGVPSIYLQKQMKDEILRIYDDSENILCMGSIETTARDDINTFLQKETQEPKFVITTYHSCHIFIGIDVVFDVKIGDEAHHLVGTDKNTFCSFHQIRSKKSLFMTATEKCIEIKHPYPNNSVIYSMDDKDVFGYCIDRKSVKWAIEKKKITDYHILVLKNTKEEIDNIIRKNGLCIENKDLFLSCYMCLKAIEKYKNLTHMLLYTNTVETSILAMKYLDNIVSKGLVSFENVDEFYNKALHSQQSSKTIDMEIERFKQSKLGIISCVYLFGEGFDLPKLNGVCVAENMQSEIRIVQYLLRPNRIDRNHPEKESFIVLPYMDTDDWETENRSFEKVRKVVSQMRNSDDTIEQKIRVGLLQQTDHEKNGSCSEKQYTSHELFENLCELERLKLRLRYSKTLKSKYTQEEDEYYYIRSLNERLGIESPKEYTACKTCHPQYIENAEHYFKSKGVWKGWKDFLNIKETNYMSWNDWKKFCIKKKIMTREKYEEQCLQTPQLPKAPEYVYEGFSNVMTELDRLQNKRRGIRM